MKPASELLDQRFGRLIVKERQKNRNGYTWWSCICDCGNEKSVSGVGLIRGRTQSCGCLLDEARKSACVTHGARYTRAYQSWAHMIQRCTNPKNKNFNRYGERGIGICERWMSFANFYADMGECPPLLTLDRKNNDGNYEPTNCRWATRKEQSHNSSATVLLTHNGKTQMISAWANEIGIKATTLYMRIHRGWPTERVLTGETR